MESRFGHDFSRVRVHADSDAAQAATALHARAFTVGEHLVFGREHYNPGRRRGDWLLAHELAHVVQQRGAPPAISRRPVIASGTGSESFEHEAAVAADRVVAGQAVSVPSGRSEAGIQRSEERPRPGLLPTVPCGMDAERFARKVADHAARHQINPILVNDTKVSVRCDGNPQPCHVTYSRLPITVAVRWRTDVPWAVAGWDRPNGRKACRWTYRCEERDVILDPVAQQCLEEGQAPAPPGGPPAPAPPGAPPPPSGGYGALASLLSGPFGGPPP